MERILKAQAHRYSLDGEKVSLQSERFLKKHRDIQKVMDRSIVVANPYASRIMVNPHLHIVTRKQEQYLRIIYNIAFLRQHSREKKRETDRLGNQFRYIEVMREDIETANEIVAYVFRYTRGDLTKRLHDAYRKIEGYCTSQVKKKRIGLYEFRFSRREIREYADWKLTTSKELLDELESLEYIRKVRGSQGKKYLYMLNPYDSGSGTGSDLRLLDPSDL